MHCYITTSSLCYNLERLRGVINTWSSPSLVRRGAGRGRSGYRGQRGRTVGRYTRTRRTSGFPRIRYPAVSTTTVDIVTSTLLYNAKTAKTIRCKRRSFSHIIVDEWT